MNTKIETTIIPSYSINVTLFQILDVLFQSTDIKIDTTPNGVWLSNNGLDMTFITITQLKQFVGSNFDWSPITLSIICNLISNCK